MLSSAAKVLFSKAPNAEARFNKWIFGTMLIAGICALIAALVLSIEKVHLLQDPGAKLSCSFNLVLNCSTVMQTPQASVLGFPNSYIGLIAYSMVIVIAVVGLLGAKLARAFWVEVNAGYLLGVMFAYWLFFQSVFVIQVLCPWCLIVTFTTTLIFASMTHYNLRKNIFNLKSAQNDKVQAFLKKGYHQLIVASWVVLMIALVFVKFGADLFA
ncbi:MAG: hypothetical protein JWN33_658 [Candidatus Saccharibacteria bacterium]|nr:hypothetical protein [Candidatus Saccharibacteria bacterium]